MRVRNTSSNKICCPFLLRASLSHSVWQLRVVDESHSHAMDFEDRTCGSHRLGTDEIDKIKSMSASGIRPRKIFTAMKKTNKNLKANIETVHNLKKKFRREYLAGRSPTQALLDFFRKATTSTRSRSQPRTRLHICSSHIPSRQSSSNDSRTCF